MYLSPEWSNERYGETIFVERVKEEGKLKTGNEKYETLGRSIRFASSVYSTMVAIHLVV